MTRLLNTARINQWLDVPSLDPEDGRRRKLLNILLLGITALTALTLIISVVGVLRNASDLKDPNAILLFQALIITLMGMGVIFAVNRFWSGPAAAIIFLLLLTSVLAVSDAPAQIVGGRSMFLFTIPVIMASVLLRSWFSFAAAGLVDLVIVLVAQSAGIRYDPPSLVGFFAIALLAWFGARSIEQSLSDLRIINRELDQRVLLRTQELADALTQVQAEANKNQAILASIADGVIVFNESGHAFVANAAVKPLLGISFEEILGRDLAEITRGHISEDEQIAVIPRIRNETHSKENLKLQWGSKHLSVTFATVQEGIDKSSGKVVVFRDYTAEAELDRMKDAFVSVASHELRTPLNAILGHSDLLKEGMFGPLNSEQLSSIGRIIANVNRLLALVNNLLDSASIEAGRLMIHRAPINVRHMAHDIKATMQVLAEQKGLALNITVEDDVPEMLVSDAQRVQQILINLIGNATKFTTQGQISVRIHNKPDQNRWEMQVTDTGPGIPPEAQSYIFESFRQVDNPFTRHYPGSGLGLWIVKQLVNLLGGEVSVQSEIGKGSTFTVQLPDLASEGEKV